MKRLIQLIALLCPLVQLAWGDANPTVFKWPGSFALDTRSVKAIDTQADLDRIQPIVVKTRDSVVTQTAPYTGVKKVLAWSPAADGSGEIAWRPDESGTWKLSKSGSDGSGSATFEVASALFHGTEDGTTVEKAYWVPSAGSLAAMIEDETYDISIGKYIRIDPSWVTSDDLQNAVSKIDDTQIKYVLQGGTSGTYLIADATGESIYTGIWDSAPGVGTTAGSLDGDKIQTTECTFRLDNRPRTAAEPLAFASTSWTTGTTAATNASGETTIMWPFTFEKGEQNSLRVLNPNNNSWTPLTGGTIDPTRPDKSGTLTWAGPVSDGGVYQINNQAQGRTAYFSFPYPALTGNGTAADPYKIATTNAFGRLLAGGFPADAEHSYVRFVGALASDSARLSKMANAVGAIGGKKGFAVEDPDTLTYKFVDATGTTGNALYEVAGKFALDATASDNSTNLRTVDSLDRILPIRYSGGNGWAFDSQIEATVSVSYAADFNEASLAQQGSETFTGLGSTTFAPDANGLYRLAHTSRGETLTALFKLGNEDDPALTALWEGTLGGATADEANLAGDSFRTVLATPGLKDIRLELAGDVVNTNYFKGALQVPAAVTNLVIDLKGQEFHGFDGVADMSGALAGLVVLGAETDITIIDTVGGGILRGGNGYDADAMHGAVSGQNGITFPVGYVGKVTVGDGEHNVTVKGGNGGQGGAFGAGAGGYSALSFQKDPTAAVVVKDNASVIGGDGGSSTVGNGGSGAAAVWVAFVDNSTPATETGSLDLTVEAGGTVKGGEGGTSTVGTSGSGGAAARLPTSDIATNTVTVASGAVVAGGNAGDAGVTGTTTAGAQAITGAVTIESSDESDPEEALSNGSTGSYIINSQEDLDLLADNYASKSGNTDGTLNIKIGSDVGELTIDDKVQGANIDLNGQSVGTITAGGGTTTAVGDTSAGASGTVGTINSEGAVNIGGGTVTTVSGGGTVVVEPGVAAPAADEGTKVATIVEIGSDAAMAALLEADGTAKAGRLTADVGGFEVAAGVTLTLDLNGHTIRGANGNSGSVNGKSAIAAADTAVVTLKGTGTLVGGDGFSGTPSGRGAAAFTGDVAAADGAVVALTDGADGLDPAAMPVVKIVKIQQRYPWNGYVDVDYTLENYAVGVELELYFTVNGGTAQKAEKIVVAPTYRTDGTNRMTWNAAAEIVDGYVDNVTVSLRLVK